MDSANVPFTMKRLVKWGECDPAGIIYTPRVLDYALEALEAWYRDVLDAPWMDLNWKMNMGAPTVRLECDFLAAPTPDREVAVSVRVESVGRTSLTFLIDGMGEGDEVYFRIKLVACLISRPDFKATEIPEEFRRRIAEYQVACGESRNHAAPEEDA